MLGGTNELIAIGYQSSGILSFSSSPANTWSAIPCVANTSQAGFVSWVYAASPSVSTTMTITASPAATFAVYEIIGAASSSPFDRCGQATGSFLSASGTVTGPSVTPSTSNGLVVANNQEVGDTITGVSVGFLDVIDIGAYSGANGDQDGGLMHYYNPNTNPVQVNWTYSAYEVPAAVVGEWVSVVAAFKAAP